MARYLKQGMPGDRIADQDDQVRRIVEEIIEGIGTRGDAAPARGVPGHGG